MNTLMYALGRLANYLITGLGVLVGALMLGILIGLVVVACQAIF